MKQLSSADFRKSYASLTEPVEVTSYGKVILTCYPAGADLPLVSEASNLPADEPVSEPAPGPMTIRPALGNPRGRMIATQQRIIDPIERENYAQLQAKRR